MVQNYSDHVGDQKYSILVVDDNQINQIISRKILEKGNFSCTIVDDGYQAIDLLEVQDFDVILMDINMPLISGYETTKLIRSKGVLVPIIALTAFGKQEVIQEVISCGMSDILTKPYEADMMYETIHRNIAK